MDKDEEFVGDFEYWWSDAGRYVELPKGGEKKLREVFFEVLSKLPEDDREKFFGEAPNVICSAYLGFVFRNLVAVPPGVPKDRLLPVNFIFLRHDIVKRKNLPHLLAHEIAHIVRGDHKRSVPGGKSYQEEKATDDLVEKWGFRRSYSKKMLARIASALS